VTRRAAAALAAALLLLLAGYKGWLLRTQRHGFHEDPDDYAGLSLGHAINVDAWPETFPSRKVGYFQLTHPGLPLQAASWLAYRAARPEGPDAESRALSTLRDPARFWLADRVAAGVLFAAALLAALAAAWRVAGPLAFLVPLALLAFAPAWPYALEQLGIESFALPIFLALWLAVRRAVASPPRAAAWLVVGALGGLAYLNKLNYVAWLVAAGLASLGQARATPGPAARRALGPAAVVAGAAGSIAAIGTAFLGTDGLAAMLRTHLEYLVNTGLFGSGEPGVVKASTAWANFVAFVAGDWGFTAWLVAALTLLAWARPWRPGATEPPERASARGPMALFLGGAIALTFLAAMKHYQPRYLVPMVVALAFALLELRDRLRPGVAAALAAATLAAFAHAGLRDRARVIAAEEAIREAAAEADAVRALPLHGGGVRLWLYKVPAVEFSAAFVLDNAARRELLAPFYGRLYRRDVAFTSRFPDYIPWEYLVTDRATTTSLPESPTLEGATVAFEGRRLLVLRRRPAAP
jgi:hypothetical protein